MSVKYEVASLTSGQACAYFGDFIQTVVELIQRVFEVREMESQRLNLNVFKSGQGKNE